MVEDAACSWISPVWVLSSSPVDIDHVGGGRVERGDLLQHQPLVGHRLGDGDRGAQRRDGGGRGAVDALDQLDIVLLDQVEGEIALHRHRHLGQQVGGALAGVEQRGLADRLGLGRLGRVELVGLVLELLVERSWRCGSSARACPSSSTGSARSVSIAALSISSSSLPEARRARIAEMWVCGCWYLSK